MIPTLRSTALRLARRASASQRTARGVLVLAAFVVLLAGGRAGAHIHPWFVAVVGVGAILAALQPDSPAAGMVLFLLLVFWWWSVPSSSGAPVLVAAAGMLGLHVAATLAAYGPPTLRLPQDLVGLWVTRGLLLWLVAVAAWLAARSTIPVTLSVVPALVLVAGVLWWAAVRLQHPDDGVR